MTAILLDPEIRDWVVLPLFIMIVIVGWLRQEISLYLVGAKGPIPTMAQRVQNKVQHIQYLRRSSSCFTSSKWYARKGHAIQMLQQEIEYLSKAAQDKSSNNDPMEAMFSNPMGMLGGNMVFMVQNMVLMQGIQLFFSGFILLKIPFALTVGFKNMFQRGLEQLPDLDPSYVSSVSWYFLVLYGLRSFFKLVTQRSFEVVEQDKILLDIGLQNPVNPMQKKQDPETLATMVKSTMDQLEIMTVISELDSVEKRLLKAAYPKKSSTKNHTTGSDFLLGGSGKSKKRQ